MARCIGWFVGECCLPYFRRIPTFYPDVCVSDTMFHVASRNNFNARISTDLKASISPGNVSQHRPLLIRTIVGVPAYLCPSLAPLVIHGVRKHFPSPIHPSPIHSKSTCFPHDTLLVRTRLHIASLHNNRRGSCVSLSEFGAPGY